MISKTQGVLAAGLGALVGCGAPQATDSHAVSYQHQSEVPAPAVNLADYAYHPQGPAIQQSAAQGGSSDSSVNYFLALRSASVKLRGDLPPLSEIRLLQAAVSAGGAGQDNNNPAYVYNGLIHSYLYDTANAAAFNRQMVQYWKNTLRMGNSINALMGDTNTLIGVDLNSASAFAARLSVTDADMRTLFTQASNTCPSFDPVLGQFADGSCFAQSRDAKGNLTSVGNNVPEGQQAGVLTNPGFLATFYSNFGFRRARMMQEIFSCSSYPAEFAAAPVQMGPYLYSNAWPPNSIPSSASPPQFPTPRLVHGGGTTANKDYVNFTLDCQNCHATINRRAALFAVFDATGFRQPQLSVYAPVADSPYAQIQEYLNPGDQVPAWKYRVPTPDFASFGAALASDPQVIKCMMIRAWNHAYSHNDVVNDKALVPDPVISDLYTYFVQNGYIMRKALYKLYTDANFIRF